LRAVAEPLVGMLASVWSSIADLVRDLDEPAWLTPTDCPGWTVKDNVAHMIGTERMLMGEQPEQPAERRASTDQRAVTAGERARPGSDEHVRNDIGRANEQWVSSYRAAPGAEVLAAFEAVTARRLGILAAMSGDEWDAEGFTPEGPGPYRQFMAIRVFDCWYHEQDIREALARPGNLEGPVADLSIGRIARGLPYVVGKKAAAPQGTTIVFDVAGEPRLVVPVGVEGRAAVLDVVPSEPSVRLRTDRRTYSRLAGGRWSGATARQTGTIEIDGDRELGDRVVDNLAFTI
jgi:uncharacterized protein (TIGR03083 family)